MIDSESIARILAVKLSSLGDVVRVTPCLRALRLWRPGAEIVLAVDRHLAPLVRRDPNLDVILENEPGSWRSAWRSARASAGSFDLALDFQGTGRSLAWMVACPARLRAGRGRWRPGWHAAVPERIDIDDARDQAHILEHLGVPVRDLRPKLYVDADADAAVATKLAAKKLPPRDLFIVNPCTRWLSKTWPWERYAHVIRWFWNTHRRPAVLVGGPAERAQVQPLLRAVPEACVVSLAGEQSLAEAVALYQRAALMLTGDSGPMHAAAAVGTRVVALFGPTWPERSGPFGNEHIVIQRSRPERHRAYRQASERRHMLAIDVETVCKAVARAWAERNGAGTV
jgi:ADP-heptose:LPS heptosyltransferase